MTELLTAAQMRAIEQAAIESGEVTGLELMERAGRGVVEAIFEEWPELAGPAPAADDGRGPAPAPPELLRQNEDGSRRAVVLCGPGNNGGDGFVVARLLREAGWAVEVFLYGDAEKLPRDARVNYERWGEMGAVRSINEEYGPKCGPGAADLVIDALFGIGLNRKLDCLESWAFNVADIVDLTRDGKHPGGQFLSPMPKVVAIDLPTGFDADSGSLVGSVSGAYCAFEAHLTITFQAAKHGHFRGDCSEVRGKLHIVDIGLEDHLCRLIEQQGKSEE